MIKINMLWIVKMSKMHYFFIFFSLSIPFSPLQLCPPSHCSALLLFGWPYCKPKDWGLWCVSLLLACKAQTSSGKFSLVLILAQLFHSYVRVYEVLTKSFLFSLSLSPSLPLFLPLGLHLQRFNFNSPVERERFSYFVGTETGLF